MEDKDFFLIFNFLEGFTGSCFISRVGVRVRGLEFEWKCNLSLLCFWKGIFIFHAVTAPACVSGRSVWSLWSPVSPSPQGWTGGVRCDMETNPPPPSKTPQVSQQNKEEKESASLFCPGAVFSSSCHVPWQERGPSFPPVPPCLSGWLPKLGWKPQLLSHHSSSSQGVPRKTRLSTNRTKQCVCVRERESLSWFLSGCLNC